MRGDEEEMRERKRARKRERERERERERVIHLAALIVKGFKLSGIYYLYRRREKN